MNRRLTSATFHLMSPPRGQKLRIWATSHQELRLYSDSDSFCVYQIICAILGIYLGFIKDAFVVVVAQRAGQLVVVHVWLALAIAPESSYFVWIFDDELAGFSLKIIILKFEFLRFFDQKRTL